MVTLLKCVASQCKSPQPYRTEASQWKHAPNEETGEKVTGHDTFIQTVQSTHSEQPHVHLKGPKNTRPNCRSPVLLALKSSERNITYQQTE